MLGNCSIRKHWENIFFLLTEVEKKKVKMRHSIFWRHGAGNLATRGKLLQIQRGNSFPFSFFSFAFEN